ASPRPCARRWPRASGTSRSSRASAAGRRCWTRWPSRRPTGPVSARRPAWRSAPAPPRRWRCRSWRRWSPRCGRRARPARSDERRAMRPFADPDDVRARLDAVDHLVDDGTATALFLATTLAQPVLLEGEPGVGKTSAAKALARALDTPLIRLQCYEGLTASEALYEWNYQRQLLAIRLAES